jgi:hypothetical protein
MVDFCCGWSQRIADCLANSKFPGDKNSDGKSGEEFEK